MNLNLVAKAAAICTVLLAALQAHGASAQEAVYRNAHENSEEYTNEPIGQVDLASPHLELGWNTEKNTNQISCMRFEDIMIPRAATIDEAFLKFTVNPG